MKTRTLITCICFLILGSGANAQFWKKIKERAKEAAEETVLQKTAEKAASETDKAMEKVFNLDFGKMQTNADPAILPASYNFGWKYTLEMKHKKGTLKMHYYLSEDQLYFGSRPEMEGGKAMGDMLMIMDPALSITAILMERNGRKFGQLISLPESLIDEAAEATEDMTDYTFKEIGTKDILGYECQGFEIENEEYKMQMYVALDAPVSFNNMAQGNNKTLPKGFDPKWLKKAENGLMMEMQFVHKKKSKLNSSMTCIGLEESPLEVFPSEYEFPQFNTQHDIEE